MGGESHCYWEGVPGKAFERLYEEEKREGLVN